MTVRGHCDGDSGDGLMLLLTQLGVLLLLLQLHGVVGVEDLV